MKLDPAGFAWVQVVAPGYVRVVKNEGMPKSKAPGQKGDLKIVFDVAVRILNLQSHAVPNCC